MMMAPPPHVPVLLGPILRLVAPVEGVWIDGTLGAGGYARALVAAGAARVLGIDRDPEAIRSAADWPETRAGAILPRLGRFGDLDLLAAGAGLAPVAGVVLDIGVSSMQLDQAERGFSFLRDGPLDMRMEGAGPSAADLVNRLPEARLADILHQYGEERAARRIARAIVRARAIEPIETTGRLAAIVAGVLPRPRPGQPHPATRSFQAIRIAVNDELGELARGLAAAERVLAPGGVLAVVTFHSLEDRIVKRFLQIAGGGAPRASRHAPAGAPEPARFTLVTRRPVEPDAAEVAANPRARSARLRIARRTDAPPGRVDAAALGLPPLALEGQP
jgi:16S rRNA (cytosine1402-N4)-methyltransferase